MGPLLVELWVLSLPSPPQRLGNLTIHSTLAMGGHRAMSSRGTPLRVEEHSLRSCREPELLGWGSPAQTVIGNWLVLRPLCSQEALGGHRKTKTKVGAYGSLQPRRRGED